MEWEERNPLEKRRAKLVDYEADPVPALMGSIVSAGQTHAQLVLMQWQSGIGGFCAQTELGKIWLSYLGQMSLCL